MSVVQRCPNCGTTQGKPGECEACHEAKVRYFCTNHEPGIWLDGPACPQCAARSVPAVAPTARPRPLPPPPRARVSAVPRRASPPVEAPAADLPPAGLPSIRGAGGFLLKLVFRFALVVVALIAMLGVALYAFAHVFD